MTVFGLMANGEWLMSCGVYSFLEYVPGGSIASCLRKHGKFDEEVTKSFTGQILSGLEYLHSKGILHRVRVLVHSGQPNRH